MKLIDRAHAAFSDHYVIEREIGRGATAVVYLADDLKHGRQVALKVLRPEVAEAVGPERFQREIDIVAAFAHPHILPLFDSGTLDGLAYYVMPFIEGESLRDRLEREGTLPVAESARLAREVAEALEFSHRHGIVHRDIKPENILLVDGHAVVADFGIARILEQVGTRLTLSESGPGTPAYMAPEQATPGADVDGRTDVYALGCVLFEMLGGEPPFSAATAQALIAQHLQAEPPSLTDLRPDVPADLDAAVEIALRKEPERRFPSAAAFAAELGGRGAGTTTPIRRRFSRLLRPGQAAAVILAVLAVLVLYGTGILAFPGESARSARRSFLVQPHRTAGSTPEEERLAAQAARTLTRFLTGWREVRAVPSVAHAGLGFDLGLAGAVRSTLDESLALARRAQAGTLATVTAEIVGDTAFLQVVLFDVESQEQVGEAFTARGHTEDVQGLMIPVAKEILGLAGAPDALLLRRETEVLQALQELQEGVRLLEEWQLGPAEQHFRQALARDSVLARAHYYLAMTLYWQAARDPFRAGTLDREIRTHAASGIRYSDRLPYRDSLHVAAFAALALDDYPEARARYEHLLASDTTDPYAWLLLGTVEHDDPVVVPTPRGRAAPRGSPNRAAEAFLRAVRLNPDFSLGYGYLFDLYRGLATDPRRCTYRGFLPADTDPGAGGPTDPGEYAYRCLVGMDSLLWIRSGQVDSVDLVRAADGAEALMGRAYAQLERWAAFAPASPRPHEEMAAWLLEKRLRVRGALRRAEADALARDALFHWRAALALKADTTVEDLVRLASLHLAAGESDTAVTAVERALAQARAGGRDPTTIPHEATNPFLATGRLSRALELASVTDRQVYAPGPSGTLRYWADTQLEQIRVLGALGAGGARLRTLFEEVERIWERREYDQTEKRVLRRYAFPHVSAALLLLDDRDASFRDAWLESLDSVPAIWSGLLEEDPSRRRAWLARAEAGLPRTGPQNPVEIYLLGLLAQRADAHETAVRYLGAVRSWVPRVDRMDPAWGLAGLALFDEARSREALGHMQEAAVLYDRFLKRWAGAGAAPAEKLARARDGLARVGMPGSPTDP